MTSIFDQYEQASQVSLRPVPVSEQMTSSGYINMQLEDNTPMFSKQKMNFNPSDLITHVAVSSDYLVLAMANGKLFRLDLKMPDQHEEIHYAKFVQPNSKLTAIFLDPLGYHLLMTFAARNKEGSPELVYLHRKSSKLKPVTKSKNYEVTEVGWNYENQSLSTTGPILLGTSQGHILETELETESDKMFTASQQYWRQIFDIGKGANTPITGIQFHRVNKSSKFFIFVTTPTRLYQFIGHAMMADDKPSLQSIFHPYLTTPETGFQEIPSTLKYSKLQFYFDKTNSPKTFAWLTEPGIFYGQLDPTSQQNSNSLFTQSELINYPAEKDSVEDSTPLSFVLTEFHVLLMFSDRVKAVSLLNQELVYEEKYSEVHGKLKNIVQDPLRRTIWAVTDKAVFRYKVKREERNVWRIYSDKEQFDLAKLYCQNNPAFIDIINVKQAELLFSKGNYDMSAEIYAETQSSFETVCLKFLEVDKVNALKVYLGKRLDALEDDKTLISMIVIWMTELYLSQLGSLRRKGKSDSLEYYQIQSDFEIFLLQPTVAKCMQHIKSVIYDLMSSHGDKDNLIKLTVINEDYENVIAQNIYKKSYIEALKMLQAKKKPELFYQFAPSLMEKMPSQTATALIAQGTLLNPTKLLPAFLSCENDEAHISEIIRYLEFMLQHFNVKDRAIHNYLLTLYVEYDQSALMKYLDRQGQEIVLVNYDVHYALR
ncbi:jg4063 [Pararge aegeria aegeria]|uniref:Jg4063 protein n=3 Tax=Pararge aegeria TaxID=116150 RepID=A0A8S4RB77_9NEOP|nr:jg4063 [Pararge aegeria aegeria]